MSTARSAWPIRRFALGAEPSDDLAANTTATERLAMMWPMAREGWLLSGRTLPACPRAEMPIRRYALADAPDAE